MLKVIQLPYYPDLIPWAATIADQPGTIFLDSCPNSAVAGRYSILTSEPHATLNTAGVTTKKSLDSPFNAIKKYLRPIKSPSPLPFHGGAMGYFGYDLDCFIGIYDWALISDAHLKQSWFVCVEKNTRTDRWLKWAQQQMPQPNVQSVQVGSVKTTITKSEYQNQFNTIQEHILNGDVYQINFAQRFQCETLDTPWNIYLQLRTQNPAPYSAFICAEDHAILSLSPERFLQIDRDGRVETKPIKGTRPRHPCVDEDKRLAEELSISIKDRAENVMIVDLLRNDLSKNCIPGSVKVPQLFAIESFPAVHHLVSTVTGQLKPDRHALDCLRDCFPGGSITGAPKIRAMQIIQQLESHRRGIYCGAIGFISHCGNLQTNIAIRTLLHQNNLLTFWAGGGIVADSQTDHEYQECFDKIHLFLKTFEGFYNMI